MAKSCGGVGQEVYGMTLKEELEILRGEPIEVLDGNPMDIPCIETSDSEQLCENPVVSVHMITYNHEPYIRQAIEGVMMQKTDFEFELVIGEDASQDKTREICFEYQKKYPDKIRILWWHENLRKVKHPAGGNARRVTTNCRGDFIAFCEGDDCWIDDSKLQRQVDAMRKYPQVGLCFTDGYSKSVSSDWQQKWHDYGFASWFIPEEPIASGTIAKVFCLGKEELGWKNEFPFVLTATALIRKSYLEEAMSAYEIFNWKLTLGDLVVWLGVVSRSAVYYVPLFAVERHLLPTGAQSLNGGKIFRDGFIVRYYFSRMNWGVFYNNLPKKLIHSWFCQVVGYAAMLSSVGQRAYGRKLCRHKFFMKSVIKNPFYLFAFCMVRIGLVKGVYLRVVRKLLHMMARMCS